MTWTMTGVLLKLEADGGLEVRGRMQSKTCEGKPAVQAKKCVETMLTM